MYLDIPFASKDDIGNALVDAGFKDHAKDFLRDHYGRNKDKISIRIEKEITVEFLQEMIAIAERLSLRGLLTQSKQSLRLLQDPSNETIKTLKTFESALTAYLMKNAIKGWLFYYDLTEQYVPYIVTGVHFRPSDPSRGIEAQVIVDLDCNSTKGANRRHNNISFGLGDVKGRTISEALAMQRYYTETQELVDNYKQAMQLYLEFQPMFGKQFLGKGMAEGNGGGFYFERTQLDGKKRLKLVNDDDQQERTGRAITYTDYAFWESRNAPEGAFEEIPFHPFISMFDLNGHRHYWVLANQLETYQYNPKLGDKLILPDEQRDLIDILVDDMDVIIDDIVDGKSGGTTILCLGEPGVGKTLTAEIYSEVVGRPLYRVHSGQLGTNPDKIEQRLEVILTRAEEWGAILLIDEADVYIRERDNSMDHNAIVAAFLRKLEYFSGLLFLTTNRSDDVDDAIKSRAMAIVKYEKPKVKELKRIWQTLSKEFKMDVKDSVINELVEHYPHAVGRDVKELLKLANKYHRIKGRELNFETFRQCAIFRGLDYR